MDAASGDVDAASGDVAGETEVEDVVEVRVLAGAAEATKEEAGELIVRAGSPMTSLG